MKYGEFNKILCVKTLGDDTLETKGIEEVIQDFANMYLQIFSDPIWNDWLFDASKGTTFNSEGECVRTIEEQKSKVYSEYITSSKDAIIILFKSYIGQNIGFISGWGGDIDDINNKLGLGVDELNIVQKKLEKNDLKGEMFFYMSQLGIIDEFRGKGYSKELLISRTKESIKMGYQYGIVRTSEDTKYPLTYFIEADGIILTKQINSDDKKRTTNVVMLIDLKKFQNFLEKKV